MTTDLILGTAGHIDHGKTSLIRALTGTDTDRLPEEKRRGITIDLGFAELSLGDYRLGIVDVPGHERFVRNMLAGATGMDLAMLVVAADDSVKQQTREHLDILRILDLPRGVIALTKCDLAEAAWLDLVEAEIRELAASTFLAHAPVVRTSTVTGAGLDELKQSLLAAAAGAVESRGAAAAGPFRMAIDRCFTIAGHGTVVTGSVAGGSAAVGERLRIEPGGREVRVRSLQNHDRAVEAIFRGQRAAINLAGVRHDETRRGQELSAPGYLRPSRILTARINLLPTAPQPLKQRTRLRVHVGTAEILCTVRLLDADRLAPGESALAQLFLAEEAVSTWNQPLVLRSESPVTTIGGGRILDPTAEKIRTGGDETIEHLRSMSRDDSLRRAEAAFFLAGRGGLEADDLARDAGVEDGAAACSRLLEEGAVLRIELSPTRSVLLHRRVLARLCEQIAEALESWHAKNPLAPMIDRARLASGFDWVGDAAVVDAALDAMQREGRIRLSERGVGLADKGPRLSAGERKLLEQIVADFRQAGLEPPSVEQCRQRAEKNRDAIDSLFVIAVSAGDLVQIANGVYLHADVERGIRLRIAEHLALGGGMTVSEIRDMLGTTRKYAVPLCEYLDRIGFTRRVGDLRVLASK